MNFESGPQHETGCAAVTDTQTLIFTMAPSHIDVTGARRLRLALFQTMLDGARQIVVDLSGVSWISAASLGALIQARRTVEERGGALVLFGGCERVHRILRVTGLVDYLTMHETLADAVASLAPTPVREPKDTSVPGTSHGMRRLAAIVSAAAVVIALATGTLFAMSSTAVRPPQSMDFADVLDRVSLLPGDVQVALQERLKNMRSQGASAANMRSEVRTTFQNAGVNFDSGSPYSTVPQEDAVAVAGRALRSIRLTDAQADRVRALFSRFTSDVAAIDAVRRIVRSRMVRIALTGEESVTEEMGAMIRLEALRAANEARLARAISDVLTPAQRTTYAAAVRDLVTSPVASTTGQGGPLSF